MPKSAAGARVNSRFASAAHSASACRVNRRSFLRTGAALSVASSLPSYAVDFADQKKRVGLIGCGWYGKCDLFRLIQVAPVEVVSLCDVDKTMLANAADMVATRQASHKKPRTYGDYRELLKEKD